LVFSKLASQLSHTSLVFGEDGLNGQVEVVVGAETTELSGDIVDDGLATFVELGLAKIPGLAIAEHGVKFLNRSDQDELGVLKNLCVAWRQLLELGLLACPGGAYQAVVFTPLAWEFSVTLS
jgi:hypothetical protein